MWRRRRGCWRAPGSMLRRSNAARTGRSTSRRRRRWRARGGAAGALHNNCSGKHAGFLCVACATRMPTTRTTSSRRIRCSAWSGRRSKSLTGGALSQDVCAIDGCSVPTWAMPLAAWREAFARFGTGAGLAPGRAKAAARLRAACAAHPWHVAGTGRFCTEIMQRFGARVFVKTGAEGVYCAALPEQGLGIAREMRRRRRPRRRGDDGGDAGALSAERHRPRGAGAVRAADIRNWNGIAVGAIRPTDVADALMTLGRNSVTRQGRAGMQMRTLGAL